MARDAANIIDLRMEPSPQELVQEALTGDRQAFSEMYRRYHRSVARVVYRMTGSNESLDDLVQETFEDAFRSLAGLRDASRLESWLIGIAVRRVRNHWRRRDRRLRLASALRASGPLASQPSDAEPLAHLFEHLSHVKPKHRAPWVLHHIEGYTLQETAEVIGASLATAKRYIAAADRVLEARER